MSSSVFKLAKVQMELLGASFDHRLYSSNCTFLVRVSLLRGWICCLHFSQLDWIIFYFL